MWDLATDPKYFSVCKGILRSADSILLVYAIDKRDSFQRQQEVWIPRVMEIVLPQNIHLVGNDCNLVTGEPRPAGSVTYQEGQDLATQHGFMFSEGSSQDPISIRANLVTIARTCLDNR